MCSLACCGGLEGGVCASIACGLCVVGAANYVTGRRSGVMSSVPFR